jgi:hypothetical protein
LFCVLHTVTLRSLGNRVFAPVGGVAPPVGGRRALADDVDAMWASRANRGRAGKTKNKRALVSALIKAIFALPSGSESAPLSKNHPGQTETDDPKCEPDGANGQQSGCGKTQSVLVAR